MRVNFKADRSDPHGAALQFFTDVITELRHSRVQNAIEDAAKAVITMLIPKLEPYVLRETIQTSHVFWPQEDKSDVHKFMERVTKVAVDSAKYSQKRERDEDHCQPTGGQGPSKRQKREWKMDKNDRRSADNGSSGPGTPPRADKSNKGISEKSDYSGWNLP